MQPCVSVKIPQVIFTAPRGHLKRYPSLVLRYGNNFFSGGPNNHTTFTVRTIHMESVEDKMWRSAYYLWQYVMFSCNTSLRYRITSNTLWSIKVSAILPLFWFFCIKVLQMMVSRLMKISNKCTIQASTTLHIFYNHVAKNANQSYFCAQHGQSGHSQNVLMVNRSFPCISRLTC